MSAPQLTIATRVTPEERAELERLVAVRAGRGETVEGARGPRPYALSDSLRGGLELWRGIEKGHAVVLSREEFEEAKHQLERLTALEAGAPAPADTRDRAHGASASSKAAAAMARPGAGTARAELLEAIVRAGEEGRTADEAIAYVNRIRRNTDRPELAVNGAARRVTDLYQGGAIAPELDEDGHERHRKTAHGAQAIVWKATEKGLKWRQELNR